MLHCLSLKEDTPYFISLQINSSGNNTRTIPSAYTCIYTTPYFTFTLNHTGIYSEILVSLHCNAVTFGTRIIAS
jgi:hypothetical protein